jgi:hypothetical protein
MSIYFCGRAEKTPTILGAAKLLSAVLGRLACPLAGSFDLELKAFALGTFVLTSVREFEGVTPGTVGGMVPARRAADLFDRGICPRQCRS